jgi:hypothetical protein
MEWAWLPLTYATLTRRYKTHTIATPTEVPNGIAFRGLPISPSTCGQSVYCNYCPDKPRATYIVRLIKSAPSKYDCKESLRIAIGVV